MIKAAVIPYMMINVLEKKVLHWKATMQIWHLLMFSETSANIPACSVRFHPLQEKEFLDIRSIHDCIRSISLTGNTVENMRRE